MSRTLDLNDEPEEDYDLHLEPPILSARANAIQRIKNEAYHLAKKKEERERQRKLAIKNGQRPTVRPAPAMQRFKKYGTAALRIRDWLADLRMTEIPPEIEKMIEERPRFRSECVNGIRPCPYVGCRHNLFLDVDEGTGSITINYPRLEVHQVPYSCTLDLVDEEGFTLQEVGIIMGLTREGVRQLEVKAIIEAYFDLVKITKSKKKAIILLSDLIRDEPVYRALRKQLGLPRLKETKSPSKSKPKSTSV
jgi:hypothetical protein